MARLRLAVLSFSLLLVGCASGTNSGAPDRPNIVLFFVDDLGYYDIGAYGGEIYETPHVDRLARNGMRFTNAYAAAPVCSPTRASLLSGQYPARVGITDYLTGRPDAPSQPMLQPEDRAHFPHADSSLAEALNSHGYATHFIGKWHLGGKDENSLPTDHGFDTNVGGNEMGNPGRGGYYSPYNITQIEDTVDGQYLTKRLTDEAVGIVGDKNGDDPFFLMMSFYTVHSPLQAPDSLFEKYERKMERYEYENPPFVLEQNPDMPSYDSTSWNEKQAWLDRPAFSDAKYPPRRTTRVMRRQMVPTFGAMVDYMDNSVGRILDALRRSGLEEETLVVFYSDNGGQASPGRASTSVAPLRTGKGWLYEGGIRVPLIVKYPGQVERGSVSETPISSPDFYPTLLKLANLPLLPEQHIDGTSFASVLTDSGTLDREALYWHWPHYSNHGQQAPAGAVRSGRYKLIEYYENGTQQLFDLQDDPAEMNDLVGERPALADSLARKLEQWRQRTGAELPRPNPNYEMVEGNRVIPPWANEQDFR